jgi:predicted glycosyltransferase
VFQNYVASIFASAIITPACFRLDFGKKHIRVQSYKELAYLHPKYFQPDPGIFRELGLSADDQYVILRFNAFDAVHDIGRKGFSIEDKYQLVKTLEQYKHVFISSETPLPDDLKKYQLPIPAYRIHHALYYAQLLVSDTQTLSTEAAILGVPAIRCNNFVGPNDMSNFIELEQKYGLLYSFTQSSQAIDKAVELIKQPDIKNAWQEKRLKLLEDKIDLTGFMVEFIENWPGSFNRLKFAKNTK